MGNGKTIVIIVILFFYFILLFVDIGLNMLGLIPFIGAAFETLSESIIETLSAIGVIIMSVLAMKDD